MTLLNLNVAIEWPVEKQELIAITQALECFMLELHWGEIGGRVHSIRIDKRGEITHAPKEPE